MVSRAKRTHPCRPRAKPSSSPPIPGVAREAEYLPKEEEATKREANLLKEREMIVCEVEQLTLKVRAHPAHASPVCPARACLVLCTTGEGVRHAHGE